MAGALKTNGVVANMKAGKKSVGCRLTFPSTTMVELLGIAGFDYVLFDGEHGPFTPESLDDLVRVAEMAGLTPMARVPNIEPSTILRFLDRGILGILGPHVSTAERAQMLADACRYAPRGKRSFGSTRGANFAQYPSQAEYMEHRNSQILVMAQLEDVEVLQDLDGILAVEGIDLFNSGPNDIAQSMGLPGQPKHPKVEEFEARVSDAVHAVGKRMTSEVMAIVGSADLVLEGAAAFIEGARD